MCTVRSPRNCEPRDSMRSRPRRPDAFGADDADQLARAAREDRALLTFNAGDFARLHDEWMRQGSHHAGLIVSRQRPLGDLLRRLLQLGRSLVADEMRDRLEYLGNWPPA